VLSGDTRVCDNLIRHAQGADLLVHEVHSRRGLDAQIASARDPVAQAHLARIERYHTPSDQVGGVAAAAGVRRLVLTHLIFGLGGTPEDIAADARRAYAGPVTVGSDLDVFVVDRGNDPYRVRASGSDQRA
jgi:ribonuclease Z